MKGTTISAAFVSTNSVTQGEQVGVLWGELFRRGMRIHFGHRTFAWESEVRGKAHVHVVIIGFGPTEPPTKRIYEYEHDPNTPTVVAAKNVSPYLVEGSDAVVTNRSRPLCAVPEAVSGNKPIDGGNYLFTTEEKGDFLNREPKAAKWFRRWLGSEEFINGWERWCLWLGDCPPDELREMPAALARVEAVRQIRRASKSPPTQKLADTPTRFHVENMPAGRFLVVPSASSKDRKYIPMGFMTPDVIVSNLCTLVEAASDYHFGVLSSAMHMAWVRLVAGRLKSDYRYSVSLVYNNYPWPQAPSDKQRAAVETSARGALDARAKYPDASLADLYDPRTMPPDLVKAHTTLDRAVDLCYRPQKFESDGARVEFLFDLFEKLSASLAAEKKPTRRRKKSD